MAEPPRITIFSDFTSPATRVTESALRAVARDIPLEIDYRALEMYPAPDPLPAPALLAESVASVAEPAAAEGITLSPPSFVPRTRKAHEAARFAASHGKGGEMRDAIHHALWAEGRDIGRIDVLVELAAALGFDPADVKIALDIDRFSDDVARDTELARRLGIRAVPTLYIGSGPNARIIAGATTRAALDAAVRAR